MLYKLLVEKLLKLYNKTKIRSREPCASGAKAKATDRSQWLPQKEGREVILEVLERNGGVEPPSVPTLVVSLMSPFISHLLVGMVGVEPDLTTIKSRVPDR